MRMKIDEAIRRLEWMKQFHDSPYSKALDMAIDALKKQLEEQKREDDWR